MSETDEQKPKLSIFRRKIGPTDPVMRREFVFGIVTAVVLVVGMNLYQKAFIPLFGFTPKTLIWLTIIAPALIIILVNFVRPRGGSTIVDILKRAIWYLAPTAFALAIPFIGIKILNIMGDIFTADAWPIGLPVYGIFIQYFLAFTMPYIFCLIVTSFICALATRIVSIKLNKFNGALLGFGLAMVVPLSFLAQIPLDVQPAREIRDEEFACLDTARSQDFIVEQAKQANIVIDPEKFYLEKRSLGKVGDIKRQPLWGRAFMVWEGEEDIAARPLPGQVFAWGLLPVRDKASDKIVGDIRFNIRCDGSVPQVQIKSSCSTNPAESFQDFEQVIWGPSIGFNTAKSFISLLGQKKYDDAQKYLSRNQWNDEEANAVVKDLGEEIQAVVGVGLYEQGGTESDPYFGKVESSTTEPDLYLGKIGPYENQDPNTFYYFAKTLKQDGGRRILFMETACENFSPKISRTAIIED